MIEYSGYNYELEISMELTAMMLSLYISVNHITENTTELATNIINRSVSTETKKQKHCFFVILLLFYNFNVLNYIFILYLSKYFRE